MAKLSETRTMEKALKSNALQLHDSDNQWSSVADHESSRAVGASQNTCFDGNG